jgi:hypothetical protein
VLAALTVATVLIGLTVCAFALLNMHDRRMEARMPDPRPRLRDHVRAYLGTDRIPRLESTMAKVIDLLNGLIAQQTAASAAQATSFSNLQNAITRLEQAVRDGEASPEIQAAVNDLRGGFETLQRAADEADNGHEPVAPEQPADPTQPQAPEQPAGEAPTDPSVETPAVEDRSNR